MQEADGSDMGSSISREHPGIQSGMKGVQHSLPTLEPTEQVRGELYLRNSLTNRERLFLREMPVLPYVPFLGVSRWKKGRAAIAPRSPGHAHMEERITPLYVV